MISTGGKSMAKYRCEYCEYVGNARANLIVHKRCMHRRNYNIHECLKCTFTTRSDIELKKHEKEVHNLSADVLETQVSTEVPMRHYKCHRCIFVTSLEGDMLQHLSLTHHGQAVSIYKCLHCDFETCMKTLYEEHMKVQHHNQIVYNCGECYYSAASRDILLKHILTHTVSKEVYTVKSRGLKVFKARSIRPRTSRKKRTVVRETVSQNHTVTLRRYSSQPTVSSSAHTESRNDPIVCNDVTEPTDKRSLSINKPTVPINELSTDSRSKYIPRNKQNTLPSIQSVHSPKQKVVDGKKTMVTSGQRATLDTQTVAESGLTIVHNIHYLRPPNIPIKQEYPEPGETDTTSLCNNTDVVIKREIKSEECDGLDTASEGSQTVCTNTQQLLINRSNVFGMINVKSEPEDEDTNMTPTHSGLFNGDKIKMENNDVDHNVSNSLSIVTTPFDAAYVNATNKMPEQTEKLSPKNARKQEKENPLKSYIKEKTREYVEQDSQLSMTLIDVENQIPDDEGDKQGTIYKCPICNRVKRNERLLFQHLRFTHGEEDTSAFKTPSETRIVKQVDKKQNVKVDSKSKGGIGTSTEKGQVTASTKFVRVKDLGDLHKCAGCDYKTRYVDELYKHLRQAHAMNGVVYKCTKCNYRTRQRELLKRHVKLRHSATVEGE